MVTWDLTKSWTEMCPSIRLKMCKIQFKVSSHLKATVYINMVYESCGNIRFTKSFSENVSKYKIELKSVYNMENMRFNRKMEWSKYKIELKSVYFTW